MPVEQRASNLARANIITMRVHLYEMSYCIDSNLIITFFFFLAVEGGRLRRPGEELLALFITWVNELNWRSPFLNNHSSHHKSFVPISTPLSFVISQKSMKFPIEKDYKNKMILIFYFAYIALWTNETSKAAYLTVSARPYPSSYCTFSRLFALFSSNASKGNF